MVAALNPVRLRRYLWQVVAATFLVAVCPVLVVWWLRATGTIGSAPLGMAIAIGLSLGAAHVGSSFWETRTNSGDVLFGELMVWGFIRRWRNDRRLASALQMLGPMNQAQQRVAGGLSAEAQAKALEQLAAALEATDPYTHGHSRRVARNASMLATQMGLGAEEVARIRTAAAVHDVGKLETPPSVLRKRGPLTDDEFDVIKRHPVDGARMASVLGDAELTAMVRHHHELLDGTGYPSGLSGTGIPLGARIIAVADAFDAITSARPYRPARSHKKAIDVLKFEAGVQLDPSVVRAFCGLYSGRRPLALWASMTSLPAQVFSWIGGGVAGVATAAQVAAVAAVAAVGTAAIAQPAPQPHPGQIVSGNAAVANRALGFAARGPAGAGSQQRPGPGNGTHRRSAVHGSLVGGRSRTASSAASSGALVGSRPSGSATTASGSERSPGSEHKGGKAEEPNGKPEETKAGGKEPKGKPEEAKADGKSKEGKGISEEAKGGAKSEEARGISEEPKGKPEEAKAGGKSEEATGKPEEVKGGEEPKAISEEARGGGKSEAAAGKG